MKQEEKNNRRDKSPIIDEKKQSFIDWLFEGTTESKYYRKVDCVGYLITAFAIGYILGLVQPYIVRWFGL